MRTAIVGMGEVAPPKGTAVPSFWALQAEAALAAMADAGIGKSDIDGVVFSTSYGPPFPFPSSTAATFCEYMGLQDVWFENYPYGGMGTGASIIHRAAMGIDAGLASTVLVVNADNWLSRNTRDGAIEIMAQRAFDTQYEMPYGPYPMVIMGLVAQRHMHRYGTTSEQLAEVAVAARAWAGLNPIAINRDPITIDDVLSSRMITSPIHLLDSCLVSDGGTAYVMTSEERADSFAKKPVWLRGMGEVGRGRYISYYPDLEDIGVASLATKQALEMADVSIDDMDLVYPYDPSTIFTIIYLEAMGFCKPGEGGAFVSGGQIAPGGQLAVNTHGGLLSCRHTGFSGHSFHLAEAVKQLRGDAGQRQTNDPKFAILLCEGGWFNIAVTVLGRD